MNTFGDRIRLTTFGESHGPAMGGVLDGMPPMVRIDFEEIKRHLERRAPGRMPGTSQRREPDIPEFLSGFSPDGLTLGTPIGFIIRNNDARPDDYRNYYGKFRPNHADYTYYVKYGVRPQSGGGRASARETVSWVVAGSIVRQWLEQKGIRINAEFIPTNDPEETALTGDSTGGIVACRVTNLPAGVGNPVFGKLHARLAEAMMSINAAKAFEYGDGFKAAYSRGSESLDFFESDGNGNIYCTSNHSGGIQGGISNGMPVEFKVYFKPTPTIAQPVETVDFEGISCRINPAGRHDACVAIRAVPIVESLTALVIADLLPIS